MNMYLFAIIGDNQSGEYYFPLTPELDAPRLHPAKEASAIEVG